MRESKIQTKIANRLKKDGWLVVKVIQCSAPGFPDLMAMRAGRVVFFEVKQPGKKPRPLQEYRHKQLRDQGFEVIVATDLTSINL